MAIVYLYEPDKSLRSNIAEILQLEGYDIKLFSNFYSFISSTLDDVPNLAVCSLIHCDGSFCEWENYLNSILESPVLTLCVSPNCKCSNSRTRVVVPFTYEELIDGVNQCLNTHSPA